MTLRELDGAGPLVASFASNTKKLITGAFAGDIKALENACHKLNGTIMADQPGYDLCIAFSALTSSPNTVDTRQPFWHTFPSSHIRLSL